MPDPELSRPSRGFERAGAALGRLVLRHRAATIVLSLLACAALGAGAMHLSFSTDYRIFFAPDDPQLASFAALEDQFTRTDNVVFVIRAREGDVFAPGPLAAVQELTEAGWELPFAARVDSLTNFQHSYALDEDLVVEELVHAPAGDLDAAELSRLREVARAEPLLVGGLLADDLEAAGVNVVLRLPREDPAEVTEAAAAARALVARVSAAHPEVEIRASGMALMNDAFMEASIQDMVRIVPVMYLVMILVLAALLRSAKATAVVVAMVAASCAVVMGVGGWLGYPLTPPTAAAPTIVLTLAIADSVHIFLSWQQAQRDGLSAHDGLVEALRVNLRPVFLTSLTTMIGFLALNFAEAPPYWHLANMTAAGIAAAFLLSVTLLPAILGSLHIPVRAQATRRAAWLDGLAGWVLRHRVALLAAGAASLVAFGALAARLETNDQFVDYFDDSIAFRPDSEFLMEHLTGIYQLDFQLESGEEGGVNDPTYLRTLERFTAYLRQQPEVEHVYGYADIIARVNQNMQGDRPGTRRVPRDRELASQYLLLYELSLPYGRDLNDRLSIDRSSSRLTVTVKDLSSQELRAFNHRAEAWLQHHAPASMHARAIAPVVIFSALSDRNTEAMMRGNVASLLLISLCLIFALRSAKLGLLSLLPNIVPIVFGYGLWALLFGEINIVASVAGAICLGIIVDDTIHFLAKYRIARMEGASAEDAVRRVIRTVAPALIVTSLVLILGFGVLTASGFQMNSYLGLLTVFVVASALVADLLLLPALLVWLDGRPRSAPARREPPPPASHPSGSFPLTASGEHPI